MTKSFPRGQGAPVKSEKRSLNQDALFGSSANRTRVIETIKKKTKKPSSSSLPSIGLGLANKTNQNSAALTKIEPLNSTKFAAGTLVLGLVLSVSPQSAVISLPGGNLGELPFSEVSDILFSHAEKNKKVSLSEKLFPSSLQDVLKPHQSLRLVTLDGAEGKKIPVSARASLINRGLALKHLYEGLSLSVSVVSKEDHGYILNGGVSGVSFFLPEDKAPKNTTYFIGQPLEVIIKNINETSRIVNVIPFTVNSFNQEKPLMSTTLPFVALAPGFLFNVIVEKILENGLAVSYLSLFQGAIDTNSLSRAFSTLGDNAEWKNQYKVGQSLQARVTYIDPISKLVKLSLKPHVLEFRAPSNLPQLGGIVNNLEVIGSHVKTGITLRASTETVDEDEMDVDEKKNLNKKAKIQSERKKNEEIVGYVIPRKSLAASTDKEQEESSLSIVGEDLNSMLKVYPQGTVINEFRVTGYHLIEGLIVGTNLQQFINSNALHPSDIKAGQTHIVEITAIKTFGLTVKINGKISAVCPIIHATDVQLDANKLMKKFKIGQKLKMKVWESESGAIIMTNKKALVDLNDNDALVSYEAASVGQKVVGIVSKIDETHGISVKFFNKLNGQIPMSILVKQGVVDPEDSYRVGDLIDLVVIKKETRNKKKSSFTTLSLCLDLGEDEKKMAELKAIVGASSDASDEDNNKKYRFVSGTVLQQEDDHLAVRLDSGKMAKIFMTQFLDDAKLSEELFNLPNHPYVGGKRIEKALVIGENSQYVFLSLKPLLIHAANLYLKNEDKKKKDEDNQENLVLPTAISEFIPGDLVVGYIQKVESYGVIVRFVNSMTALCPRPALADKFLANPEQHFVVGNSIFCLVQRVDVDKEKVFITCKTSLIAPLLASTTSSYLSTYFEENYLLSKLRLESEEDKLMPKWDNYKIGETVSATVSEIMDYGVVLNGEDNLTIMVDNNVADKKSVKVGSKVSVKVLDFDYETLVLNVSITKEKNTKKASLKKDQVLDNLVISIVKDKYLVVTNDSVVGFVQITDYNAPSNDTEYEVGQTLSATVAYPSSKKGAYPHSQVPILKVVSENKKKVKKDDDSPRSNDLVKVGAVTQWEIKSISASEIKLKPFGFSIGENVALSGSISLSTSHNVYNLNDDLNAQLDSNISAHSTKQGDINTKAIKKTQDANEIHSLHPFYGFKQGDKVWAHVLQLRKDTEGFQAILRNITPATKGKKNAKETSPTDATFNKLLHSSGSDSISAPSIVPAVVTSITPLGVIAQITPYLSVEISFSDITSSIETAKKFKQAVFVGLKLNVSILHIQRNNSTQKITKIIGSRVVVEELLSSKKNSLISSVDLNALTNELKKKNVVISNKHTQYGLIEEGQVRIGVLNLKFLKGIPRLPAFGVDLPGGKIARVCLTELADKDEWVDLSEFIKNNTEKNDLTVLPNGLAHGDIVPVRILSTANKMPDVSLRASRIEEKKLVQAIKPEGLPQEGTIIPVYVTNINTNGCFFRLNNANSGRCLLKDLSDTFIDNPQDLPAFQPGSLKTARVVKVDHLTGNVTLSLKESLIANNIQGQEEIKKFKVGDVIKGTVQRVIETSGVFVAIGDTSLVGLARKAAAFDSQTHGANTPLSEIYSTGDIIKARILRISPTSLKVSLGLTENYFKDDYVIINDDEDDEENNADSEEDSEEDSEDDLMEIDEDDEDEDDDEEDNEDDEEDDDEEEDDEDDSDLGETVRLKKDKSIVVIKSKKRKVSSDIEDESEDYESEDELVQKKKSKTSDEIGDIQWDGPISNTSTFNPLTRTESDDESEDEEEETKGKVSNKQRAKQRESERRRSEQELRDRERAIAEGNLVPTNSDDFERLLIASPNSSYLWIQYMAYYLNSADVEAARLIGNRALRSINFREEGEKYNIWMSLINLEFKYGNKDTLEKVFNLGVNESSKGKLLYIYLANLYADESRDQQAASLIFERALKRPQYKKSKKVWIAYHLILIKANNVKKAKEQLSRSLQSLSSHKHVEVISKFALNEYEFGSVDRARVLFEELINSYPKRGDLWHLYVDKEIKKGEIQQARQLFERMISLPKNSAKNMKTIFKKYLEFEIAHGNEETQLVVKQKARDYVASIA